MATLRLLRPVTKTASLKVSSPWQAICTRFSSSTPSNPDESDYIQKSVIPTMHFQPSLPRLPIPDLSNSKNRYLEALKPLVSEEEHVDAAKVITNFVDNEGQQLHKELVQRDKENKHTNYITGPWSNFYLCDRRSIMLNHNPFLLIQDDSRPGFDDQIVRASVLLRSSLRFLKSLRENVLGPDVFHTQPHKSDTPFAQKLISNLPSSLSWYPAFFMKAYPLDMSQYKNLFSSTRIPLVGKDRLVVDEKAKHVIVLRKGHFYTFDVIKDNGTMASTAEIFHQLKQISMDDPPAVPPVSVLTSEERDTWTPLRHQLEVANRETLQLIDSAIVFICLDDDNVVDLKDAVYSFLCGNGQNRWFDKSFQLIFDKGGHAALHFEHSWGDGISVLRYVNDIYHDSLKSTFTPSAANQPASSSPQRLDFKLDSDLLSGIEAAKLRFDREKKRLNVHYIEYDKFGKKFLKSQKQNVDAVLQLAFQTAFYAQYGFVPSTYESCSTAAFKHGRTETVRPATAQTAAFVTALHRSGDTDKEKLRALIEEASARHSTLTGDAQKGQGFDRHLFALKCLAQETGHVPSFFQHSSYQKMSHIILSTSTLPPTDALQFGAFAPVTPNGFGVGYQSRDSHLGSVVTAYPERDAVEFLRHVEETFDSFYSLLK